jgi:hypothetical protein
LHYPKFVDPILHDAEEGFFLLFKRYDLAIYMVKVFEKKCYLNSLRLDPTIEKIINEINLCNLHYLKVAILEYSFLKHSQGILGVKNHLHNERHECKQGNFLLLQARER